MKKRMIGLGALLLCLVFCLSLLPGAALAAQTEKNTLTVGVDSISGKLNPFFITSSDDSDIVSLTQGSLLAADRGAASWTWIGTARSITVMCSLPSAPFSGAAENK